MRDPEPWVRVWLQRRKIGGWGWDGGDRHGFRGLEFQWSNLHLTC